MKKILILLLVLAWFTCDAQQAASSQIPSPIIYGDVSCHGGSDGYAEFDITPGPWQLPGTPPYSFLWSNGETSPVNANLTAGTYTLTVNDVYGFLEDYSILISEPPPLELNDSLTHASYFGNTDGQISINVSGAVPPYSFIWHDSVTTLNRNQLNAGYYHLSITDNNECVTIRTYYISSQLPDSFWNFTPTSQFHQIYLQAGNNVQTDYSTQDLSLSKGSLIGAFYQANDGSLKCAGYTFWNQTPSMLTAYISDIGFDNGFQNTEEFSFIIQDINDTIPVKATDVAFNYSSFPNHNYALINGNSGVSSLKNTTQTQSIIFNQTWSYFSIRLQLDVPLLDSIMSPVVSCIDVCKNNLGEVYWPLYGISQIGNYALSEGYQIRVNQPCTLDLYGKSVLPVFYPIPLLSGWNTISYLKTENSPVHIQYSTILNHIKIVKADNGTVFWPEYQINSILTLEPNKGYKIKMLAPDTLYYKGY